MQIQNPYHEGELLAQRRVGVVDEAVRSGRAISDSIVRGALSFVNQQPMAILASVDEGLDVWASVLFGQPGFMSAIDERTVELDSTRTFGDPEDPLWVNIESRQKVGVLVIELVTRRRLRINGRITQVRPQRYRLDVEESYPNCPKYIQRREIKPTVDESIDSGESRRGRELHDEHRDLIRGADTFFVASTHPTRGVDASHRGGQPGFVRILDDRTIRVPDYVGNNMFNTLGNLALNPRAGLLFFDFDRSRSLQLVGRAEIQWQLDDPHHETGGTRRYWDFEIERWREASLRHPFEWELLDRSPHNPVATAPPDSDRA